MNPFISELPSKVFYNGQLKDGPDMDIKTKAIWHEKPIFGPYRFFNVNGMESKTGTSTKNVQEALVAVELYRKLEDEFGDRVNFAMRIGVISMYKEQLWELKRKFIDAYGSGILEKIECVSISDLLVFIAYDQIQHCRWFPRSRKGHYHPFVCSFRTKPTNNWLLAGPQTYERCFDACEELALHHR
jgi:hypothetical protein